MLTSTPKSHNDSCNTICFSSLFVFFVIALRSFSAGAPIFSLLKNNTCTFKFDLERTNTLKRQKINGNFNPLHRNQRWENSAFFLSRGFIFVFLGGWGWGRDLLFYFVLSKIGGLEFLSIFLGKQITFILSPFYITSFGVGTIYNTKETTTI